MFESVCIIRCAIFLTKVALFISLLPGSAQSFLPGSGHIMPYYDYEESYSATMSRVSFLSHLAMFFHKCSFSLEETPIFRLSR